MARTVTVEAKSTVSEGYVPLTDEQKRALDNAGARLGFKTRTLDEGDTIELPCTVKVGDVEMYAKTFNNVKGDEKPHRRITATLTGEFAPLDFWTMSADNVQNPKTLLHKLYVAVKREVPPERGTFTYDPDDLEVDNLNVVLSKGGPRKDGRRGGFFFNIVRFKQPREETAKEETFEEYTARMAGLGKSASPAARPATPASTAPGSEDVPF